MNLRPDDVPGFYPSPPERKPKGAHIAAFEDPGAYRHCLEVTHEQRPVFKQKSQAFAAGAGLTTAHVSSGVQFARSAGALEAEFVRQTRVIENPATKSCFARAFDALGAHATVMRIHGVAVHMTFGHLTFAPMTFPAPPAGIQHEAGFTMSMSADYAVAARGATVNIAVTFYVDELAFVAGNAQVELGTWSMREPFPSQLEARLYALLLSRARAARAGHGAVAS